MLTWTIGKYILVIVSIIGVVFAVAAIIWAALVMYQRHKDKELYDTEGI